MSVILLVLLRSETTSALVASSRTHNQKIRWNPAFSVTRSQQQQLLLVRSMSPFDEFDYYAPSPTGAAVSSAALESTPTTAAADSSSSNSLSGAHARIVTLESHADLVNFWNNKKKTKNAVPDETDDDDHRIAIVLVHAKWCKSCHKVWEHYRKLARDQADGIDNRSGQLVRRGRLRLASIEWSTHTDLCRTVLGVTRLPTVVFYGPGGRVLESFSAGPTKFAELIQPTLERLWLEQRLEQGAAMIEQAVGTTSQSLSIVTPEQVAREWNWSNQKQ